MRKILFGVLLIGAAAPALAAGGPRDRNDDGSPRPVRAERPARNNNNAQRPQFERSAPPRQDLQRPQFNGATQRFQAPQAVQRPQFGGFGRPDLQRVQPTFRENETIRRTVDTTANDWRSRQQRNNGGYVRYNGNVQQRYTGGYAPGSQYGGGYVRNGRDEQQRYSGGYVRGSQYAGGAERQGYRGGGGQVSWDRNWRNDQRYNWRDYRRRDQSRFHVGFYSDPYGWNYQQFSIGYRLYPNYYEQNFWFDPGMYGLPYPPPGMQWVRYWNDALLVDIYSGEVVDEIQGFFW